MNHIVPFLQGAAEVAAVPGDTITALLSSAADYIGLPADESPDSWLGILLSGLAGISAALAVALLLAIDFRSRQRSFRVLVKRAGFAVIAAGLLAFVAYDMRHAALAYLGINPSEPAVEFEIRLPGTMTSHAAEAQVELRTDRNQTLAPLHDATTSDDSGHAILRGSVVLEFRTTDRVLILNLPDQPQRHFRLRLAANPSHAGEFGPWHLADRVTPAGSGEQPRGDVDDIFAIRYRVL